MKFGIVFLCVTRLCGPGFSFLLLITQVLLWGIHSNPLRNLLLLIGVAIYLAALLFIHSFTKLM